MRIKLQMRRREVKSKRGQALIEFALTLMVVLTALFGVIEFGRLMLTYSALADSARAGVRYAIVHGGNREGTSDSNGQSGPDANPPNVVAAVQQILSAATLPSASGASCPAAKGAVGIVVTYLDGQNAVSNRVRVTACYGYRPVISFLPFPSQMNLSSTSQATITY